VLRVATLGVFLSLQPRELKQLMMMVMIMMMIMMIIIIIVIIIIIIIPIVIIIIMIIIITTIILSRVRPLACPFLTFPISFSDVPGLSCLWDYVRIFGIRDGSVLRKCSPQRFSN